MSLFLREKEIQVNKLVEILIIYYR